MSTLCCKCAGPVPPDGIGLNKKLVNRGVTQFLCMRCLAEHFHVTEEELETMIRHFREAGCHLFTPLPAETKPPKKKRTYEKSAD